MTDTNRMKTSSVAPFLNRTYLASHAYQWVREVIVNSIQAGATTMRFCTEWNAVEALDVHRRVILDDGPGIARDKILSFLNQFGGSGKTIGEAVENFGVGFKTSTLPWNKHGVVVISKTADGEVTMIWLRYDEALEDYGVKMFDIDDETPTGKNLLSPIVPLDEFEDGFMEDNIDWTKVFPADQESGLAIILLGNTGTEHTIQGAPDRDENKKYGIVQYINSRFWELPINITIEQHENWGDPTTWPTRAADVKQVRSPKGLKATLATNFTATKKHPERGITAQGEFAIKENGSSPAATLDWTLCSAETDARGDIVTLPISGVLHEAHKGIVEIFDLACMGMDIEAVTAKTRMSQFVKTQSVRDRMILIIKPKTSKRVNVFPDQSRSKVMWANETSGGQALPWDYWYECWNLSTPTEIRQAIAEHYASLRADSEDGITDEDYRRLGSKYGEMIKRIYSTTPMLAKRAVSGRRRKVKDPKVAEATTENAENTEKDESPKRPPRHFNVGLVHVHADDLPEGEPLVGYDRGTHVGILNTAHPRYARMVDIIVEGYIEKGDIVEGDDDQRGIVAAAILRAAQMHLSLAISEAVAEAGEDSERSEVILSDEALSSCMRGIRHIESLAAGFIGQAFNGRKKVRAKPVRLKAA